MKNKHSGKCLNVQGASTANSAHIIQYTCVDNSDEMFETVPAARVNGTDYYQLVNQHSGKCLNIQGGSTANSARLIQYTCRIDATNEWFALVPSHLLSER